MKLSHVIVAIVFFLLGAAGVYIFAGGACQPAGQSGTSVGIAFGVGHTTAQGGVKVTAASKPAAAKPAVAEPKKISFRIEPNVNRHGSDYRDFALDAKAEFGLCQKACEDDSQCRAFTFVKAGIQGSAPHCWLKNTVPQTYPDTTCISGVKE